MADLTPVGAATQYQYGFAYGDGFGREIQRKALVASGPITSGGATMSPRWLGSGWTIFNNKGQPVRRYEPFFTSTNGFEFAAQTGVSSVLFYDPAGRVAATLHPDNSWEKVVFDAWRQESWDGNDTVLIADPRTDADVGAYFQRCLGAAAFTSWFNLRAGGTYGTSADDHAAWKDAAQKASAHAATPAVTHFDSLGRNCLVVSDNGGGNRFPARTAFDTESKPLAVFDAFGRRAEEYVCRVPQAGGGFQYLAGLDMAGNPFYRINADAGARRNLNNVAGKAIRNWDARGHAFRMTYDAAQRPVRRYVSTNGAAEILIDLAIYGEGQAAANLCGRMFRHYDMAGYVENSQYDFKGNLLASARQLAAAYHQAIDWTPLANLTAAAQLDAAATTAGLIPTGDNGRDRFTGSTVYDALNRPIQVVTPHNAAMKPNVLRPAYDAGAQLATVDAWLQQAAAPAALLNPATADRHAVTAITYNARNQRLSITFGNGSSTSYDYDAETFRLAHLTTSRPSSFAANQQTVQALAYYYDPVGNITHISDSADTQNVIYFQNQRVDPTASYTYDPLYRLISATGREHLGQTSGALQAPQQVSNDDSFRMALPQPGDGNAMGVYTESYGYDAIGNLLTMAHQVSAGNWTRRYSYAEPSQIVASEIGNRLSATSLPGDPAAGPFTATYVYDAHGNMTRMPHLPAMAWDEDDRLRSTTRQVVNAGTPVTSFYVYDSGGKRVRKLTDGQAATGQNAIRQKERIYLGGIELYREYGADGTTVSLERETLHIDAGDHPIAFVETRTIGNDPAPAQLVRYQFSNHLGSAVFELDDQSNIISYEEYFPFGSTSYSAVASQTDLPKRYRYTDKERDEENDLYYHGARYFAPWLGRWTACDPDGIIDGFNPYGYCRNVPTRLVDPTGNQGRDPTPHEVEVMENRGITDPGIQRRLVNLHPRRAPRVHGQSGAGGDHAGSGHGSRDGGLKSHGDRTGATSKNQPPTGGGSQAGTGTGSGPGAGQNAASRAGSGSGGTGNGRTDPTTPRLTEMDYAVLLSSLLSPIGAGQQSKEGVSGGIPGGRGPAWMASTVGQAAYIAINLFFTFFGGVVESGLRKAWAAVKPVLKTALLGPAFMFTGAGGIGGVPERLLTASPKNLGPRSVPDAAALSERGMSVRNAFPRAPEHHIFPQADKYRSFFEARGINVDEYTAVLGQGEHEAIHMPGTEHWNKEWDAFIAGHQNASEQEVFEFAGRLMDKFKISDAPLVTYGATR